MNVLFEINNMPCLNCRTTLQWNDFRQSGSTCNVSNHSIPAGDRGLHCVQCSAFDVCSGCIDKLHSIEQVHDSSASSSSAPSAPAAPTADSSQAATALPDPSKSFSKLRLRRDYGDVHVYFTDQTRRQAAQLREKLRESGLSVFDMHGGPIGPHPRAMFEAHVPIARLTPVANWLRENGANALIHPHTGDHDADHFTHAVWVGPPLALRRVW